MNIRYKDGCLGDIFTIDGKELEKLSDEEKKNLWLRLVNYLRLNPNKNELYDLLEFVVERRGETIYADEPCRQCGHWEEEIVFNL